MAPDSSSDQFGVKSTDEHGLSPEATDLLDLVHARDERQQRVNVKLEAINRARMSADKCTEAGFQLAFQPWIPGEVNEQWIARLDRPKYLHAWVLAMSDAVDDLLAAAKTCELDIHHLIAVSTSSVADEFLVRRIRYVGGAFARIISSTSRHEACAALEAELLVLMEREWFAIRHYHRYFELLNHNLLQVFISIRAESPLAPRADAPSNRATSDTPAERPEERGPNELAIGASSPSGQHSGGEHPGSPQPTDDDEPSEARWSRHRTGGVPLRGWKRICAALNVPYNRALKEWLKRMQEQTNGPIVWCGKTPEVDAGELAAWMSDNRSRSIASEEQRQQRTFTLRELDERDGARAPDHKLHLTRRPNAGGRAGDPG